MNYDDIISEIKAKEKEEREQMHYNMRYPRVKIDEATKKRIIEEVTTRLSKELDKYVKKKETVL